MMQFRRVGRWHSARQDEIYDATPPALGRALRAQHRLVVHDGARHTGHQVAVFPEHFC